MLAFLLRMMNSPSYSLPFSVLLLMASSFSLCLAQPSFWFHSCGTTGNYTNTSAFAANLNTVLSDIISSTEIAHVSYQFYTAGTKPGDDLVSGAAFCRGDLPSSECKSCYSDAAVEIRQVCPTQKQAIAWYTGCMLRYSDHRIRGIMESSPKLSVHNPASASDPEAFDRELKALFKSLQVKAQEDPGKYASGLRRVSKSVTLYALLGCTADLNASDCFKCSEDVINYVPTCCFGKIGGSIFTPNCASRFEVYQFYQSDNGPTAPSSPLRTKDNSRGKKRSLSRLSLSIAIPTFVAMLLAVGIWICLQRRSKATLTGEGEVEEMMDVECLQFDLTTIKAATRNFSMDSKLGEGGFGEVYKGILARGQEVAVKRLSKNSVQGIAEFKNEVALVAKLQHKNLVKLLGFCVALKERILVYEFLPNSSLDRFLFDPTRSVSLDWETRFKIIRGIARGLLYLHEDSRLKVIHRDLKSSNILLDESMDPKISDFGLAKLFGVDQTQDNTNRIVGTYGYMAPEYAMTGHFSVKSDVFSFGIILLEIVSGQRNRSFAHRPVEETLLHRVWRFWNEEKVLDLLDPRLGNGYKLEEITKCIHISLLCIQEDPGRRPKMTSIVAALNGDSISLPMPRAPQFFGNITSSGDESVSFNSFTVTENISVVSPR